MISRCVLVGCIWTATVAPAKKLCGCNTGKEERPSWSLSEPRSVVKRKSCIWGRSGLSYDQPISWCFVQLFYTIGISAQLCENICCLTCYKSRLETNWKKQKSVARNKWNFGFGRIFCESVSFGGILNLNLSAPRPVPFHCDTNLMVVNTREESTCCGRRDARAGKTQ